jgi:hypothetical protein
MKQAIDAMGGEGRVFLSSFKQDTKLTMLTAGSGSDHPGFGNLLWSYPGRGSFKNDDSRTIWGGGKLGPQGLGNINSQST